MQAARELNRIQETDEGRRKVPDLRKLERTLFGRVDGFETSARCLKKQPAVEIHTISRQ